MDSKPSYLGAFLKHPTNSAALLVAACAAVFASFPLGWAGVGLVGVVALGTEALAALTIPSLPSFRAWVDRQWQEKTHGERRAQLLAELRQQNAKATLSTYAEMCSRVQALYKTAGDSRTALTRQDVEKLDELTLDYLSLSLVHRSLQQRNDGASENQLSQRIAELQGQLQKPHFSEEELRQIRGTLAQFTDALQRTRRLAVRKSALEATLLSMPDKMEEVYQLVITSPYSTEMGGKLEESLARLRIAEEVAAEFSDPAFAVSSGAAFEPPQVAKAGPGAKTFSKAAQQAARSLKN